MKRFFALLLVSGIICYIAWEQRPTALGAFANSLIDWTLDPKRPFGLSDQFAQGVFVNLLTSFLQLVLTFLFIKIVVDSGRAKEIRRTKLWIASRLRDELYEFILELMFENKHPSRDRLRELSNRADALVESSGWSVSDRFLSAIESFSENPGQTKNRLILVERFNDLLFSLSIPANKREIFADRIKVALRYSNKNEPV